MTISAEAWFNESTPKRDYGVYINRRRKETAGMPVTRSDSDYYLTKKRKEAKQKKIARESASKTIRKDTSLTHSRPVAPPEAKAKLITPVGKSTSQAGPKSQPKGRALPSHPAAFPHSAQTGITSSAPRLVKRPSGISAPPSPVSSLDSILNSDHEIDEVSAGPKADRTEADSVGKVRSTKRKYRVISSPVKSTGLVKTEKGEVAHAPAKKAKMGVELKEQHGERAHQINPSTAVAGSSSSGNKAVRLAGLGRIVKRTDVAPPTFGQPEPGIFSPFVSVSQPQDTAQDTATPNPTALIQPTRPAPSPIPGPLFLPSEITETPASSSRSTPTDTAPTYLRHHKPVVPAAPKLAAPLSTVPNSLDSKPHTALSAAKPLASTSLPPRPVPLPVPFSIKPPSSAYVPRGDRTSFPAFAPSTQPRGWGGGPPARVEVKGVALPPLQTVRNQAPLPLLQLLSAKARQAELPLLPQGVYPPM